MKHLVIAGLLLLQFAAFSDMPGECFNIWHPSNALICERAEINGLRYHYPVDWPTVPLAR